MKPTARRYCTPLRKARFRINTLLSRPGAALRASGLLASVAPAAARAAAAYPDREQRGGRTALSSETEAVGHRQPRDPG